MSTLTLPIRELAQIVHSKSDPWKLMALFRAFFDESGLHGNSPITGIAGFIGPAKDWELLEESWIAELSRFKEDTGHDINVYHATECNIGKGPWFGIQAEIREAYNLQLAKIIKGFNNIKGISISVETDAWNKFASDEFKDRYQSPYQLCAENCFQQVAYYSKRIADNSSVALAFAEHNDYSRHISEVFSYYLSNKSWANIKSLTFASPVDCICLQASDMISYESFRYWNSIKENGFPPCGDRAAFEILAIAGHFEYSACYGDAGIINAVKKYHSENGLNDPFK